MNAASIARSQNGNAAAGRPASRSGGPDAEHCALLIVEDEFLLAIQMEQILAGAGFRVAGMAGDAQSALRLAEETDPDLVLMDVRLNGQTDGVDAAIQIWQRLGIRSLFMTGNVEIARSPRADAAHAAGVLSKPYQDREVVRAVSAALSDRH